MIKHIIGILVLIVAILAREKIQKINAYNKKPIPVPDYNQTQLWFDQLTDHFDYTTKRYWKQRYWVIRNFYNKNVGPVYLYICGQYVCPGIPQTRKWAVIMAQRTEGIILVLQHRYYGQSMPFGNDSLSIQNLKYLNTEQALKDLAYFIMQVNKLHLHGIQNSPWITIGGSYPGALSAWFRNKYPHLTIGAIGSSAVVNIIEDFQDYDQQIYLSLGKSGIECVTAVQNINNYVQSQILGPLGQSFKTQFGATQLTDTQFFYYWADLFSDSVQYGARIQFCQKLLKGKTFEEQYAFIKGLALQNDPRGYAATYLSNPNYFLQFKGERAWGFQYCTQFGWFQTASHRHPMRSTYITVETYREWCKNVFGPQIIAYTNRSNNQFGKLKLNTNNLFLVNGQQDPWKWAGYPHSSGDIISVISQCNDCAHCSQLYTPSVSDSPLLKKVRDQEFLTVNRWIQNYWQKKQNEKLWNYINSLLQFFGLEI